MAVNLRGDQGTVTFGGSPTIVNGTQADIDQWEVQISRRANQHRPFGWALPKVTLGGLEARGRFHIVPVDGQTIGIPAASGATNGELVLGTKGTTHKYTFDAQIYSLSIGANSSANTVTDGWYEFVGAADASTDTITPA